MENLNNELRSKLFELKFSIVSSLKNSELQRTDIELNKPKEENLLFYQLDSTKTQQFLIKRPHCVTCIKSGVEDVALTMSGSTCPPRRRTRHFRPFENHPRLLNDSMEISAQKKNKNMCTPEENRYATNETDNWPAA